MIRRKLFAAAVILLWLSVPFAVFVLYFHCAKAFRLYVPRPLRRLQHVQHILADPKFRHLQELMGFEKPEPEKFETVWDTDSPVYLSSRIYEPVEMYGVRRYRPKAGVHAMGFQVTSQGSRWFFETLDTPEINEALKGLYPRHVYHVTFDSRGFRKTDSPPCEKTAGGVFFAGDSFTQGLYTDDQDTFVSRYSARARRGLPFPVCVVNGGVNGYGSLEEAYEIEHFYGALKFNTVFLMYFPNDVHYEYLSVIENKDAFPAEWKESLRYLARISAFCREHGIRFVLVPIPPKEQLEHPEYRANYQDRLKAFCEKEGCVFLDPFETFKKAGEKKIYLKYDPHFSAAGHAFFAEWLWNESKTLVTPRRESVT